jgi:hypothetical protein
MNVYIVIKRYSDTEQGTFKLNNCSFQVSMTYNTYDNKPHILLSG